MMAITGTIRAIVFARNCEDSRSFFVPKIEYRNRSPPENFGFHIQKFKNLGGNRMYYDVKESGKRIKNLRNISQLTQRELAEKLNISHSMMAKIEQGTKMVSVDLGIEIAEYFDVTLDYLFLGRGMKTEKLEAELELAISILKNVKTNL